MNDLFVNNSSAFNKTFGNEFRIEGIIGFKQEGRKITLRLKNSNTLEDGINFNFNFHDDIEPQQAKLAIEAVSRNYDKDINKSNKIIKDLIGATQKIMTPTTLTVQETPTGKLSSGKANYIAPRHRFALEETEYSSKQTKDTALSQISENQPNKIEVSKKKKSLNGGWEQ